MVTRQRRTKYQTFWDMVSRIGSICSSLFGRTVASKTKFGKGRFVSVDTHELRYVFKGQFRKTLGSFHALFTLLLRILRNSIDFHRNSFVVM